MSAASAEKPPAAGKSSGNALVRVLFTPPSPSYFLCWVAAAVFLVIRTSWSTAAVVVAIVVTPILWTFQEYCAHRFLMHGPIKTITISHFGHHRYPMDERRLHIPMIFTIIFASFNYAFWAMYSHNMASANLLGNIISYFLFEYAHFLCHTEKFPPWSACLRTFHLSHHVVGQYVSAFGFTSCAWDRILGTMSASYQTVPSSMARSFVQAIPYPLLPFFLESILFGQPGQGTDSTGASSKHQ